MAATTATNEASEPMTHDPIRTERFRAIYTAHYDDLWRYCLRRTATPAEAEDVLADVCSVAWRRLDDVPAGESARPWLFTVARNHLHNRWRQSSRERAVHLRLVAEVATAADVSVEHVVDDDSARVLEALGRLGESDAEILRLTVWDELPHREIAQVMACSENAVAIRIHRARRRLAELLPSDLQPNSDHPTTSRTEGDRHA